MIKGILAGARHRLAVSRCEEGSERAAARGGPLRGLVGGSSQARHVDRSNQTKVVALAAALMVALATLAQADTNDTTLVSRASGPTGAAANGGSRSASISSDGRFVAFTSDADNLSDQDNDAYTNVYVRDLQDDNKTTYVSRADGATGTAANGDSSDPSISADGRYVAFASVAANLSTQDNDTCADYWYDPAPCSNIFVRDLLDGTTTYVSRADGTEGAAADGGSYTPAIFPDGHRVAFISYATNLSDQDKNDCMQNTESGEVPAPCLNYFLRNVQTGATTYLAPGLHDYRYPGESSISADGRFAAIESDTSLSPPDNNDYVHIHRVDLQTGETTLASRADGATGTAANGHSSDPSISADGRYVAFESDADSLSDQDIDAYDNVYVRDLQEGRTTLASRADGATGTAANSHSSDPSISADGRYVAFWSDATNLSADGTGVFMRDLQTDALTYVSRASGADGAGGHGQHPSISGDGRLVAFESDADNLSTEDNDAYRNVFVREVGTGAEGDTVAPETTITSGPSDPITDKTPTFEFDSSEAGSSFECQVDTGAFAACTSPYTTQPLAVGSHTFSVRATDAAGNTDPTPASQSFTVDEPTLSIGDFQDTEGHSGTKTFSFTLTLSKASTETVTVDYTTADGTARVANGDYTATSGTATSGTALTFSPGETSKTISVSVKGDRKKEKNETFSVNLSSPTNATITDNQGIGTIMNDD